MAHAFRVLILSSVVVSFVAGCATAGDDDTNVIPDAGTLAACDRTEVEYLTAIDGWYTTSASGGHPTGRDLVAEDLLDDYDDSLIEIVPGEGTRPTTTRRTSACTTAGG